MSPNRTTKPATRSTAAACSGLTSSGVEFNRLGLGLRKAAECTRAAPWEQTPLCYTPPPFPGLGVGVLLQGVFDG